MKNSLNPTRRLIALGAGLALLTSCWSPKEGARVRFAQDREAALQSSCREMGQVGNEQRLSRSLRRDVNFLLALASEKPSTGIVAQATKLEAKIEGEVAGLRELANSPWMAESWNTQYAWTLEPEDFGPKVLESVADFHVLSAVVTNAQAYGHEVPHSNISVKISDAGVDIDALFSSSAFDLCELKPAIAITLHVTYEQLGVSTEKDFVLFVGDQTTP